MCIRDRVSFAPVTDGDAALTTPLCIVEAGLVREAPLRALAAELSSAAAFVRCKGAFAVDREEAPIAMLLDGGAGALALVSHTTAGSAAARCELDGRALELGISSRAMIACRNGDAGDWEPSSDASSPAVAQLFVIGRQPRANALRSALRACIVPDGYHAAADEEVDFGSARGATTREDARRKDALRFLEDDDASGGDDDEATSLRSIDVVVAGRALTVVRRADGSYFARDCCGSDVDGEGETAPSGMYEVIKLFGSSLYVRIPDTTTVSVDERDRGRIRAALAGDVVY